MKTIKAFDSTEKILKHIHENSCYIWRPYCNASNYTLGCFLSDLVDDGLLQETDISTCWWIFEDSKIKYTLTNKGEEYLKSDSINDVKLEFNFDNYFNNLAMDEKLKIYETVKSWNILNKK